MVISLQVPPAPAGASHELREALENIGAGFADSPVGAGAILQSEAEWLEVIAAFDAPLAAQVRAMADEGPRGVTGPGSKSASSLMRFCDGS